jgi:hypothetical protein
MPWSAHVTDTFFAPELSRFTAADIPDMTSADDQQEHWLSNYLLNSVLRGSLPSPARQQIYNFLRRSHSAFADYELARIKTEQYLADRERIRAYIAAVGHWEDFLGHVWQANEFLTKALSPEAKRPMFQPGDGSVNQRLHALHTRAKHAAEAIMRGEFLGETPLCVWLTNDGLKSTDSWLTYREAAEELQSLAAWAKVVEDPLTMKEKSSAMAGEQPNDTQ